MDRQTVKTHTKTIPPPIKQDQAEEKLSLSTNIARMTNVLTSGSIFNLQRMIGRIRWLRLYLQYKYEDHCQHPKHNSNEIFWGFNSLNDQKRKYPFAYHQHDKLLSVSVNEVIDVGRDIPTSDIALCIPPKKSQSCREKS